MIYVRRERGREGERKRWRDEREVERGIDGERVKGREGERERGRDDEMERWRERE